MGWQKKLKSMTHRERVLIQIIRGLYSYIINNMPYDRRSPDKYIHFDIMEDQNLKTGDLVMCATSGVHPWTISTVHQVIGYGHFLLKDLHTGDILNMSNEGLIPIRNFGTVYTADQWEFKHKVMRLFERTDHYWHRYGGVKFNEDDTATVYIRERYGGVVAGRDSVPVPVTFKWHKNMTQKQIKEQLDKSGYSEERIDFETVEAVDHE